jgi:hypothetical protein
MGGGTRVWYGMELGSWERERRKSQHVCIYCTLHYIRYRHSFYTFFKVPYFPRTLFIPFNLKRTKDEGSLLFPYFAYPLLLQWRQWLGVLTEDIFVKKKEYEREYWASARVWYRINETFCSSLLPPSSALLCNNIEYYFPFRSVSNFPSVRS